MPAKNPTAVVSSRILRSTPWRARPSTTSVAAPVSGSTWVTRPASSSTTYSVPSSSAAGHRAGGIEALAVVKNLQERPAPIRDIQVTAMNRQAGGFLEAARNHGSDIRRRGVKAHHASRLVFAHDDVVTQRDAGRERSRRLWRGQATTSSDTRYRVVRGAWNRLERTINLSRR